MPVRPVLAYPHPTLKTVSPAGSGVDDQARAVAQDLLETLRAHPGCVGLSAPQIGIPRRIIAVDVTGHPKATVAHGPLVIIEPRILASDGSDTGPEACLSIPDTAAKLSRAVRIYVKGLTILGEEVGAETSGLEARVIQHEIDHLDGILILDRAAPPAETFPSSSS